MKKKHVNVTLSEEVWEFVEGVADEIGSSKSAALDLIIDTASGNLGMHMILYHYKNGYNRKDGRKKDG